ncbi:MAG TPA: alpha/beta fold hydrolase [Bacillota bacterium]|nr:alpha/beta fold hydrolase [Bacillota bacterium]
MIFEKQIINTYKSIMYARCDDNGTAYYFSANDFPGLHNEPFSFIAAAGHRLRGYIYQYDNPKSSRLVVLDHGIGGGHRSYMKEIELLCRHGYSVLAYDHTGCMESGGEGTNGMSQSQCDLNDCIVAIRSNVRFSGVDISVMGHSWGGYAALNILALHPDISHVIVLSGFISVEECVNSFFYGILRCYRKAVMEIEQKTNHTFVNFNAVSSLSDTKAKILLIYSDNDTKCRRTNYDILFSSFKNRDNIRFLLVGKKGHNPNYTHDAVNYLDKYIKELTASMRRKKLVTQEQKKAFVKSYDWNRMTAQDESVWKEIWACLDDENDI